MDEKRERSRERTERREKTSEGETSEPCTRHTHTCRCVRCYNDVTGEAHSITSHNHTWLAAGILCFVIRQISAGRATWNLVESLTLAHERGKYYISGSTSRLNTFGYLRSVSTKAFLLRLFSIGVPHIIKTVWRSAKCLFIFFLVAEI